MENASKALIIAGAILLSILIIALGMNIFNSASDSVGSADMSAQEVDSHNQTFTAYEGKVKGTTVRTLLNMIATNNEENEDRKIKVTAPFGGGESGSLSNEEGEEAIRQALSSVKTKTTYKVEFGYNTKTSLIETCDITLYGGSSDDGT